MKIYNEEKTIEMINPDLAKGYLKPDKLLVKTIPAIEAVEEKYHDEPLPPDASGGIEYKKIIDVAGIEAKPEEEIYEDIQIYVLFTEKQLKQRLISALKAEIIKVKEDIEQVILAGMERSDLSQKQQRMAEIIKSLRVLEGKPPVIV